jgi:hypothetical protein
MAGIHEEESKGISHRRNEGKKETILFNEKQEKLEKEEKETLGKNEIEENEI